MNSSIYPTSPAPYDDEGAYPKPRWKLLRSWLKLPRPTHRFAPRLSFNAASDTPPPELAAHWGEHVLIEDNVTVLHRDGTSTWRLHFVTQLAGANELAAWDELWRSYDIRTEKHRVVTARLLTPGGGWRKASQKVHTVPSPGTTGNVYGRAIQLGFHPLRPGVIVELEETYDRFRVDQFGPTIANQIYLRTGSPCRRRRFVMAVARPFTLNYELHHGASPPVERQVGEYRVYTWEVTDAEGVEVDDWTPPPRDHVPWVDVSTAKSWAPFAAQFRQELEPPTIAGHDIRQIAD